MTLDNNFLNAVIHYKYLLIFPIAILEGPIIGIISGFLVSVHYLNFWIAFLVLEAGDLAGDSIYYAIGRYGRIALIEKFGHYIGLTSTKLLRMEKYFENNTKKTLIFGKFAQGTGSALWIAAGMAKLDFGTFFEINAYTTAIKVAILLLIGYFFGQSYQSFQGYIDYLAIALVILLVIIYLLAVKTNFLNKFFGFEDDN